MKNKLVKSISAAALALLLVGASQMFVFGQSGEKQERSIEGAWRMTLARRNCQTGAAITIFQGLQTFNKSGTLAETLTFPAPSLRTPGHGVWSRGQGAQNYSSGFHV